ncbi:Hypothetical predicted protein [Podarcis lilfordi]|uniref:Uncharacterized protein n=1 Tax=Podarcis lilfordi TaxID=74358 RepID=A0AA35L424_9SAUR|nr:Hypothetical predicted protein [Podarcis lilfordi]
MVYLPEFSLQVLMFTAALKIINTAIITPERKRFICPESPVLFNGLFVCFQVAVKLLILHMVRQNGQFDSSYSS